jgi:hypothetical protein
MKKRNRLGATVIAVASIYAASSQVGHCADQARTANPNLVSFYEVPLICPAAPQIGCGSASKPLLLELEHSEVVSEAWLNRAGTTMAIVWSERSKSRQRSKTVKTILKQREIDVKELAGDARQSALKDFQSGSGWYRGADVDRLSEEEAGIMAGRLIRKIRSMVTLTEQNSKAMQEQFTKVLTRRLTGELPDRNSTEQEILKICRQNLNEQDVSRLQEALKDFRPNKDEP